MSLRVLELSDDGADLPLRGLAGRLDDLPLVRDPGEMGFVVGFGRGGLALLPLRRSRLELDAGSLIPDELLGFGALGRDLTLEADRPGTRVGPAAEDRDVREGRPLSRGVAADARLGDVVRVDPARVVRPDVTLERDG